MFILFFRNDFSRETRKERKRPVCKNKKTIAVYLRLLRYLRPIKVVRIHKKSRYEAAFFIEVD